MVSRQLKKELKCVLNKLSQKLERNTQRGGGGGGHVSRYAPEIGKWIVGSEGSNHGACFSTADIISGTVAPGYYVTYDITGAICSAVSSKTPIVTNVRGV